ncbi:hypothetical protein C8R44DRAFT_893004 [Mycena epipterygia]|nr:hypothetical protein C8R44DRAFT_893004 [Mycena epipterygia]
MDDAEQDSLHAVLHNDNTVLVATTLATLFLAGSALICRSGRRLSFSHTGGLSLTAATSQTDSDAKKRGHGKNAADGANDDGKDAKNARSKERRRRGKDPLKEILKGGKKLKMLAVAPRDRDDTGSSTSASTSPLPQIIQSGSSQRSASVSTSSRSVSSSTAQSGFDSAAVLDSDDGDATPATTSRKGHSNDRAYDRNNEPSDGDSALRDISEMPELPMISISSSSSASTSASLATPGTSPSTSPSDRSSSDSTVLLHSSPQFPAAQPIASPWDWDGQGSDGAYHKPPRFRSKSRGSPIPPSVSMPYTTSFASTSSAEPAAYSPQQPSSSSSVSSEDFTFPTLNATVSPTSPESSRPITGSGTPRRVPTPRRTPTPGSGGNTPPPSLATQTQIASLRGALEAARMREEKARADLDRYAKDFEMMRWENHSWRRRELELQGQIHHLMHQLQAYAAMFASTMTPPPSAQPHLHAPNGNSPGGPNGHAPPSPSGYPGMFPPTGMLSPVAVNGQPFFAYPAAPPPPPPPHHQQPNLFSMLFPLPAQSTPGSGPPSSVSGSTESSGGSVSPDLVGSPAPVDRGRRRERTQTAEARLGMAAVAGAWDGEMAEGWVGVEAHDEGDADAEDDDEGGYEYEEDNGGFSEVLADAILKRPESIRVRSRKRDKGGTTTTTTTTATVTTEFTFPSISDFGGVHGSVGYRERNGNVGSVTLAAAEQEHEQQEELEQEAAPEAAPGISSDGSEPVVLRES